MNIGRILMGWLVIAGILVLIVVALVKSGIVSIRVEKIDSDEPEQFDEDDEDDAREDF